VIVPKFNFEILVEIPVLRFLETKKVVFTKFLSVCVSVNKVLDRRSGLIFMKFGRIVPIATALGVIFLIFNFNPIK